VATAPQLNPYEMAVQAIEAGLNVSSLTQEAIRSALAAQNLDAWLSRVLELAPTGVNHEEVLTAVEEPRERSRGMATRLIVDAMAMVDYLVGSTVGPDIGQRLDGVDVHVPAHFDAEVLSALGRLHRAGKLNDREVDDRIDLLFSATLQRHLLMPLLAGAWKLRHNLRLVDALYVELANQIEARIITTDAGLAAASAKGELVGAG